MSSQRTKVLICALVFLAAAGQTVGTANSALARTYSARSGVLDDFPPPPPPCTLAQVQTQQTAGCLVNATHAAGNAGPNDHWAPEGYALGSAVTVTASASEVTPGQTIDFHIGSSLAPCDGTTRTTVCWQAPSLSARASVPAGPQMFALDGGCIPPAGGASWSGDCPVTPRLILKTPQPEHWLIFEASISVTRTDGATDGAAWAEIALRVGGTHANVGPSFTVSPFGSGNYQFISTTPVPSGTSLTYRWDFGDGKNGSGPLATETYAKPGTYTVRLSVTSSDGATADTSQQITVAAPKLSTSVTFPGTTFYSQPPQPDVGDTIAVNVDVSASDGVGNITNVAFSSSPLQIDPGPKFTVVDGPTPPPGPPATLSPNSYANFSYHLKAQKLGIATLSSHVTGIDATGGLLQASGSTAVQIGKGLIVDVTPIPTPVTVPLDSQGNPVPQPVAITVTVTNPLSVALSHVTLDKPPVVQHLQASENLDPIALDTTKPLPALDVGTLAPGQKAKVTFQYLAIHDGDAELDWFVSAPNPDAPTETIKGVGKGIVSVNPTYLLDLTVSKASSGSVIKAGEPFDVSVRIKNVTNAQVVHLDPIRPVLTGNAGGGNPFDIDNPPPPATSTIAPGAPVPATECNPSPPVPGSVVHLDSTYILPWSGDIGAGHPLALWGVVQTVPDGPNHAAATYHLTGSVQLSDGTTRPLTDADVKVSPGNGSVAQSLDTTDPVPAKADFTSFTGNFGLGMIRGTCEFSRSTFDSVAWVLKAGYTVLNPRTYGVGALKLYQAIEYGITWYRALTPAQQDSWVSEAAQIIWDQTADKSKTSLAAIKKQVNADALQFWSHLIGAWNTGDMNTVAETMGDVTANTSLQVLTFIMPSADVVSLSERAHGAEAAAQGIKDATKLEDGINLIIDYPDALPDIFGMAETQVAGTSALAVDKGVLIAVRSRHPLSDKLVKLYNAVTKPGSIAVKTVNDIDVAYLGYNAADTGLVALFQPNRAAVEAAIAHLDADVQSLVLARLAQRESEWNKYLAKYQGYAKSLDQGGGVPVEFDWTGNGVSRQPNPGAGNLRGFDLATVGADGSARPANYFLPRIADRSGVLRVITGDVDVVGIVEANGRAILSAAERIDVYKSLMQILDMQHPETLTWLTGGAKQVDLLIEHVGANAERLAVFGPDGNAFTASINAALTTFDANNALLGVWFNGAYKSSSALAYHYADIGAAIIQNTVGQITNPYISATSWFLNGGAAPSVVQPTSVRQDGSPVLADFEVANVNGSDGDNHGMLGNCPWQFSVAGDASVLYTDRKGGLLQWSAGSGQWSSFDVSACGPGGAHPTIHLLPQTALVTNVSVGATTAAVYDLPSIDHDVSAASTPWFGVGNTVVIDPGQPNQETRTVKSLNPLRFDQPLHSAHTAGAIVSVIQGSGSLTVRALVIGVVLALLVWFGILTVRTRRRDDTPSWRASAVNALASMTDLPRRAASRLRQRQQRE